MNCPRCGQPLIRRNQPPYLLWVCSRCGGCAATLAVLRKGIRHDFLQHAWNRTIGNNRRALLRCPGCSALMNRVPTCGPEIDLCRKCQMMWFDAGELEELPKRTAQGIAADKWADELRQMQRRREDREFYTLFMLRHPIYSFVL
jgi:Zn-finger nucleic acid-binding protein